MMNIQTKIKTILLFITIYLLIIIYSSKKKKHTFYIIIQLIKSQFINLFNTINLYSVYRSLFEDFQQQQIVWLQPVNYHL
jgi:hypothetical protein